MVKRINRSSMSEDDGDGQIVNENGKRPSGDTENGTKKRLKGKSLYRQPTVRELNRLQETENLFNSNLFRLQVDEVLEEVKVSEKSEKRFTEWYTQLKSHLENIVEDKDEYDLTENKFVKKFKVKIPLKSELKKTKCMFKFHKFDNVEIIGSYALGCAINSKLCVDIQITIPAETYTKNDSVNYKYHKKRAAYLAYIASHLKSFDGVDTLNYTWYNGCETFPVLDIKPKGKIGNTLSVRIHLNCESEAFKLHRFSPDRNNLRESWLFTTNSDETTTDIGPPTPYYNNGVLRELTADANNEFLSEVLSKADNLKQAVVLLKIWLRQRDLKVSGHVISMLVSHLVQMKRVNNIMSSYQIVRNVWIAIKTSEWDKKGISLHKEQDSPSLEEFHTHFPVVFLDRTGFYNLCGNMCVGTYNVLKRESALAIEMLDNGKINSFIPLFMVPVKPLMEFDHILRFKNISQLKEAVIANTSKVLQVNYGVDRLALIVNELYSVLVKGLGNRVKLVQPLLEANFSWPIGKRPEKVMDGSEINLAFGFILDPENAMSIVEKGPPANLPEAEEFRAFWGDKSELRRFQDGSITECCVWEGANMASRATLTKQILDYLLHHRYGVAPTNLYHVADQFSSMARSKEYADSECIERSVEAIQAFDQLRTDLRSLTDLPLDVSAVYGVSPVFSYCDPFPPLPHGTSKPWRRGNCCLLKEEKDKQQFRMPDFVPVAEAVFELGHSGKWPGDLEAFRCLKTAFYLQISERLNKQFAISTQVYPTHMDVLKNGLVFRLRISHPKEVTLLRREIENGVVKFRDNDECVKFQFDNVVMPRLRGALHGLHQRHPTYGPTCCLMKRWLSSHLLAPPHFPAIVAELLVASVFIRPEPLEPPASVVAGFLRALRLLATTNWSTDVLILDFNGDLTREEILESERNFGQMENKPAMCIMTSVDNQPLVATPSAQTLGRVLKLAASTLGHLDKALGSEYKENVLNIFVPSLSGYDVLIHLEESLVPRVSETVHHRAKLSPLCERDGDIIPVVEFDPVQKFLEQLRSAYDEFAVFFHDKYGGDVIAVLWRPDIDKATQLQISNAKALKPIKSKGETLYKVNKEAIVEDFRILGRGLVKDITVNS